MAYSQIKDVYRWPYQHGYIGKSTDIKPFEGVPDGSLLVEADTGVEYQFHTGDWHKKGVDLITAGTGRKLAVTNSYVEELLERIWLVLKKIEIHQSIGTGMEIPDSDVEGD